ncbi:MAG: GerMN domain-containing protein [Lachnospiraceae bacterium]|nr:GerMN domain-containing protein [Lachnospiraceae bacterium]
MKKRWKYAVLVGLLLLSCLLLSGCQRETETMDENLAVYQIYYLNPAMTRLVSQEYRTETTETDYLIQELMEQFRNVPAYVDCQAALSDKVVYQGYKQEDIVLYLYFDNNYTSMKSYREILCRAALARTMTQIPGIEYINIYSGQQPLMDADGMPVGMVSSSDFIDSISDVNSYEKTELTLYFTDELGEMLYAEKREVVHNINTSLEQVILGELIQGPEQEGLMPTLDPQTKLLNVSVNENVCYLNFDTTFLGNQLEVREYIPIYSIVNSLSELSSVNRVQFTINGEQNATFRESVSLSAPFGRNLDYIGGTEN